MRGEFLVLTKSASLCSRILFTLCIMVAAAFIVLCSPVNSKAEEVAFYDIGAQTVTQNVTSVAVSNTATNVSASAITKGPGVSGVTGTDFYDGGSFCLYDFTTGSSIDTGDYFQIVITPAASTQITYTNVIFALARDYEVPNYVGPANLQLHYSTDGTNFTHLSTGSLPIFDLQQTIFNISLSSIGTVSGTVTFRLYGYNGGVDVLCFANASASPYFGVGANVAFYGTVASTSAPEMDVQGFSNSIADGDATPSATDHTDFGSADVTSGTVARTFTVENTGDDTLNLTGSSPYVTIGGTHAADFSVTSTPSSTIESGETTTFEITFDPSATGARSANLSIANDDSDENPYNFSIQGLGTTPAPEMDVQGFSNSIADGDATPSATDHTDFGDADVTSGSVVRTFTIENQGNATLSLTDSSPYVAFVAGAIDVFSVTSIPSSTIASGESTTFEVTFDPDMVGTFTAILSIDNDDSDENPYNFSIQGNGTEPLSSEMDVQGFSNSIADGDATPSLDDHTDFGSADVTSETVARTFTIENQGTGTLSLTGSSPYVAIGGTHAADFSVTSIPSSTVSSSGGTTTFEVTFDPSATGARSATLSIANDDSDESPYDFSIQGAGTTAGVNNAPTAPELVSPSLGAVDVSVPVTFKWNASTDANGDSLSYDLYVCDNPSFTGCDTPDYTVASNKPLGKNRGVYLAGAGTGFIFLGIALGGISRRRKMALVLVLLIITAMMLVSCGSSSDGVVPDSSDYSYTTGGFGSSEPCFWKVVASDGVDETPSSIWGFVTE